MRSQTKFQSMKLHGASYAFDAIKHSPRVLITDSIAK